MDSRTCGKVEEAQGQCRYMSLHNSFAGDFVYNKVENKIK